MSLQTNTLLIFVQYLFGRGAAQGLGRKRGSPTAALSAPPALSQNNSALALTSPVSSTKLHLNLLVPQVPLLCKELNEQLLKPERPWESHLCAQQLMEVFLPPPPTPRLVPGKYSFLQLVQ